MVCVLLCNMEPMDAIRDEDLTDLLAPPEKRAKLAKENESVRSSTTSSDSGAKDAQGSKQKIEVEITSTDGNFRYLLLEGRSNTAQIQNKLCDTYRIERMKKNYDIFDRKEIKFIEVKVTLHFGKASAEYSGFKDNPKHTALVYMHSVSGAYTQRDKRDEMPGVSKAKSFLLKRAVIMSEALNLIESELAQTENLTKEVFVSPQFNNLMETWIDSFWKHRKMPLAKIDLDPSPILPMQHISEKTLKKSIEDTSRRETPFMQYKGKLLPEGFIHCILTEKDKDGEILDELFSQRKIPNESEFGEIFNWTVNRWNTRDEKRTTFNFLTNKEMRECPASLIFNLGIGAKKTKRFDDHPGLKQKEFVEPEKMRYSAWMSNLIAHLAKEDKTGLSYFDHLKKSEFQTHHPVANLSIGIVDTIFESFSSTNVAAYASRIKNFYSRIGGAYLKRGFSTSGGRPSVVIFPIYSSGHTGDKNVRKITGFAIRGPQHAKKPTERIPIITFEMVSNDELGSKFKQFIKKPNFIVDNQGINWCVRVNSIMLHDSSYLAFVINSVYLTANLVGELTVNNPSNSAHTDVAANAQQFVQRWKRWLMERTVESVLMATLGASQEEGALAIIRKIFMIKLSWSRGKPVSGSDIVGFADSLNECLLDQPLALYFAQQMRNTLDG
uniref:Polymerase PA n=1 Tax=Dipteran orthomyxo-related virus OKIAV193 TaxID=2746274 RepID=A0A7D7J4F5_9ORTO|nr:polymerase PA [Dipteran orthomyxo-related virus OKIAV193]